MRFRLAGNRGTGSGSKHGPGYFPDFEKRSGMDGGIQSRRKSPMVFEEEITVGWFPPADRMVAFHI
jgi:hypothetical protein